MPLELLTIFAKSYILHLYMLQLKKTEHVIDVLVVLIFNCEKISYLVLMFLF